MNGETIFDYVKYFSTNENWGDYTKLNGMLILTLDKIRDIYGKPFFIHCAYATSGHSSKSQHYVGNAVDFHIITDENYVSQIEKLLNIFDLLQISDRIGFGIYPDWNNPGFHFDVRGIKARWGRIGNNYVSLEEAFEYTKQKFLV